MILICYMRPHLLQRGGGLSRHHDVRSERSQPQIQSEQTFVERLNVQGNFDSATHGGSEAADSISLPQSPLCPLSTYLSGSPTPEPRQNISASPCPLPTLCPPSSSFSKPRMLQPRLVSWPPSSDHSHFCSTGQGGG